MNTDPALRQCLTRLVCLVLVMLGVAGCATSGGTGSAVTVSANQSNVVAYWNDIANQTVLASSQGGATAAERHPAFFHDVASVHVAIYDAVVAIEGRFKPFTVKPAASGAGASLDAAVSAAAYGVLKALFPSRGEWYQAAYDRRIAAIPDSQAKVRGLALGSEVAAGVVRLRAGDGRDAAMAPYVSASAPGRFRSANATPIFRHFPAIKPFALVSLDQFRPAPPPTLDSAAFAAAIDETRSFGGVDSSARTAEQLETARFHTEPPPPAVTRNLGRFASSTGNVADAARLMAMIYVSFADAIAACFEAKYHYDAWRPVSAIHMADAAWKPVLPTPNHPEYPAAHSCTSASLGETLRSYYGTPEVTFTWDSNVTGTTRTYAGIDAFNADSGIARIYGGMHFRFAIVAGEELGRQVARWVNARHFGRQD